MIICCKNCISTFINPWNLFRKSAELHLCTLIMPCERRSHTDCRRILCLCCGVRNKNNIELNAESPLLNLVHSYVNYEFDVTLQSNPNGVCPGCKVHHTNWRKGRMFLLLFSRIGYWLQNASSFFLVTRKVS